MCCHVTCGFTCPLALFLGVGGLLEPLLTPPSSSEFSVLLSHLTLSCLALGQSVLLLTSEGNTYSQCTEGNPTARSGGWQVDIVTQTLSTSLSPLSVKSWLSFTWAIRYVSISLICTKTVSKKQSGPSQPLCSKPTVDSHTHSSQSLFPIARDQN